MMTVQQGGLDCLPEIIRRIVEVAAPEKIILFGSGARGTMGPDSDLDLVVVKRGEFRSRKVAGDIYLKLRGIPQAVDVIVLTPEQVDNYAHSPYRVIFPALREGKVIYERKG
ncbi:MAG: Nucleotidyltransferase domain protein [Methanoregulaceae archaeon PtaU1.Bin222]|nr:MAG: Nucleotidyltransferase domain protein [Methanoregulaceae archaeon PtaU1.Bin222]